MKRYSAIRGIAFFIVGIVSLLGFLEYSNSFIGARMMRKHVSNPFGNVIAGTSKTCFDNDVFDVELVAPDRLLVGGGFQQAGPCTGAGVPLTSSGALNASFDPNTMAVTGGAVTRAIGDSGLGWYIAGDFTHVGGLARPGLARISQNGTLDLTFVPEYSVQDSVRAMTLMSGKLFIGGGFEGSPAYGGQFISGAANVSPTGFVNGGGFSGGVNAAVSDGAGGWYVGGEFNSYHGKGATRLAHILSDGSLDNNFRVPVNGAVRDLLLDGTTLYVLGDFSTFGGVDRVGLASVSTSTGIVTGMDPRLVGGKKIQKMGSDIVVGGEFEHVNVTAKTTSAFVDPTTGAIVRVPNVGDGTIETAIPDGSGGWFIGGSFSVVNGEIRARVAQIDSSGNVTSWKCDANFLGTMRSLTLVGNDLFFGGDLAIHMAGSAYLGKIDATTGALSSWNPNVWGTVKAMSANGGVLYVAGNFSYVAGDVRIRMAAFDISTGSLLSWAPHPNGDVSSVHATGSSVFVGGQFATIGGASRPYLAELNASTAAATSWAPNPNGIVTSLEVVGTTVYAGGFFSNIGGGAANSLAALNKTTAVLDPAWNPNVFGGVDSLKVVGTTIYVGGNIMNIGGQNRRKIAAVSTTTGLATAFQVILGGGTRALNIQHSGSVLFIQGDFHSVGGVIRNNLASFSASTGTVTSWNPNADYVVNALAISGSLIYVGGGFSQVGGQSRNGLAALDTSTGAANSWNPTPDNAVFSLLIDGSTIYVGGLFSTIGGSSRDYVAAISTSTGVATSWNPIVSNRVDTIAKDGSSIFIGGQFDTVNGQPRRGIAAIDASTAALTSWDALANGDVKIITVAPGKMYVGGYFRSIGSQARQNLFALDATTGALDSWRPQPDGSVYALGLSNTSVVVGGDFTEISGTPRNNLAMYLASTGALNATWNPSPDGPIESVAGNASAVYVAGHFDNIGGAARFSVAKLNTTNGNVNSGWDANPDVSVNLVELSGARLYVAGSFSNIGGQARQNLASLSTTDGSANGFNPSPDGEIYSIARVGSHLFVEGGFTEIGGVARPSGLAHINGTDGSIQSSWAPTPNADSSTLATNGVALYLGGDFSMYQGVARKGLAVIEPATGALTTWTKNLGHDEEGSVGMVTSFTRLGDIVYFGGDFSDVAGTAQRDLGAINVTTGNVNSWAPVMPENGYIATMDSAAGVVYLGGDFAEVNGTEQYSFAAVNATTGSLLSPAPDPNGSLSKLKYLAGDIYSLGYFSTIAGQSRNDFAVFNATTGVVGALQLNLLDTQYMSGIVLDGSDLYTWGGFYSVNGSLVAGAAKVDITSGNVAAWYPFLNSEVQNLYLDGGILYGVVRGLEMAQTSALYTIDKTSGATAVIAQDMDLWQVNDMAKIGTRMFILGDCWRQGLKPRSGMCVVDMTTGNPAW